jgi:hypothetical protein
MKSFLAPILLVSTRPFKTLEIRAMRPGDAAPRQVKLLPGSSPDVRCPADFDATHPVVISSY